MSSKPTHSGRLDRIVPMPQSGDFHVLLFEIENLSLLRFHVVAFERSLCLQRGTLNTATTASDYQPEITLVQVELLQVIQPQPPRGAVPRNIKEPGLATEEDPFRHPGCVPVILGMLGYVLLPAFVILLLCSDRPNQKVVEHAAPLNLALKP
ncbi:hypothetical protein EDB81DRAFT_924535 [Dactylonectria macrodidyma]|uniref:Uncharacterized protein n=1 Tax=Dactylonectria macrodidyma TaxID=307937 RepID=A0A9P9FGB3_9HYPO|nr:hypothetical protein EDB81DRAFT_924535 [Dactylonectria macrodidyma]